MADLGRPSAYDSEYVEQARKLCKLGATDEEIADFFDVSVRTIHRWKIQHEDFCHALRAGKEAADERVVSSLYSRAVGYTYDSVKIFKTSDDKALEVPYQEHVPPDVTAGIFWLKNRRPDDWRDQKHVQGDMRHSYADLSDADLERRLEQAKAAFEAEGWCDDDDPPEAG